MDHRVKIIDHWSHQLIIAVTNVKIIDHWSQLLLTDVWYIILYFRNSELMLWALIWYQYGGYMVYAYIFNQSHCFTKRYTVTSGRCPDDSFLDTKIDFPLLFCSLPRREDPSWRFTVVWKAPSHRLPLQKKSSKQTQQDNHTSHTNSNTPSW